MFTNNLIGLLLSFSIYCFSVVYHGDDTHVRIMADPNLLFDCVMVGLSGSIGQVFIFFTISLFDCYLLTIITTTRKFFSVVYSNFKFGHKFTSLQWLGAAIVMACTVSELFDKKNKKKTEDSKETPKPVSAQKNGKKREKIE